MKTIKIIGIIMATIITSPVSASLSISTRCADLGFTVGTACALNGAIQPDGTDYMPECRGSNSACKWRQCGSICRCTYDNSANCCSNEVLDNGTWYMGPYSIAEWLEFNDNSYSWECGDRTGLYVCYEAYYGTPTNNTASSQCSACPGTGTSSGPGGSNWCCLTMSQIQQNTNAIYPRVGLSVIRQEHIPIHQIVTTATDTKRISAVRKNASGWVRFLCGIYVLSDLTAGVKIS